MNKKVVQPILDSEDRQIEKGILEPEGDSLYPRGVLNVLGEVFRKKTFSRPRGKKSPIFTFEEVWAIANLIFFKPPNIVLRVYKRMPKKWEIAPRRMLFINYFLGEAKFNGAKAARMAGYSPRSAKQIAYKILRS